MLQSTRSRSIHLAILFALLSGSPAPAKTPYCELTSSDVLLLLEGALGDTPDARVDTNKNGIVSLEEFNHVLESDCVLAVAKEPRDTSPGTDSAVVPVVVEKSLAPQSAEAASVTLPPSSRALLYDRERIEEEMTLKDLELPERSRRHLREETPEPAE